MIVYVHGANATAESFSYIRHCIKNQFKEPDLLLEYQSENGFDNNLSTMKKQLAKLDRLFFISHSLGGIYSLFLANHFYKSTLGGVSLSTPYGGSEQADFARYFLPFSRLMKDIGTMSKPIREVKNLPAPPNWTQVVTTQGHSPWINEQNDGIVTVKSMRARRDFELVDIPINHYEIMVNNQAVDLILGKLKKAFDCC